MRILRAWGRGLSNNALSIAEQMDCCIYLVLDAFFAIGSVFLAASVYSIALRTPLVHIITRAKKAQLRILILNLILLAKEEERSNTVK